MSTKIGIFFAVVLFAASPLSTVGIAAGQTIDFSGKTVHLVLNAATDTPADQRQRAWAPYLQKQLPGNPKFVITNRPRGRGTIAVRFISRVAPDGLTIGGLAGVTSAWAVGEEMPVPVDTFAAIGALRANRILVTGPQAPARTIEEIVRAKRRIIVGVGSAATANAILAQMFMDIAGIPYSLQPGYAGPQKTMPGLVGGKLHIAFMDPEFFLPNRAAWARDLNIRGLLQTGNLDVGDPQKMPPRGQGQGVGLETLSGAVDRLVHNAGTSPLHAAWQDLLESQSMRMLYVLPPGTPLGLIGAWSRFIQNAYQDADYLKRRSRKNFGPAGFVSGVAARKQLAQISIIRRRPEFRQNYRRYRDRKSVRRRP